MTAQAAVLDFRLVEVDDGDVAAVAHLLRRPPLQARSRATVRGFLQAALDQCIANEPLHLDTIRRRTGNPPSTIYQYLGDIGTLIDCLTVIWQRRAITAIATSTITGAAHTAAGLADLLIDLHVGYYQLIPGVDPERLRHLHAGTAQALRDLHTGEPGQPGPPGTGWDTYCAYAIHSADDAAQLVVRADPLQPALADEAATALRWYIEERDLVVPPHSRGSHTQPRPGA